MVDEVEFDMGGGAIMFRAADGGPIRNPLTGRRMNTTHAHTSAKTGRNSIPAESNLEYRAMWILDASLWVVSYMSQPHRLEYPITNQVKKAVYTPDLEIVVPRYFIKELLKGTPFVKAALKLPPARAASDDLVVLVVEVKWRGDKRANTDEYKLKLKEARRIYERNGYFFFLLEDDPHLNSICTKHLPSVEMDQGSDLPIDKLTRIAWDHLLDRNGSSTYGELADALAFGASGNEAVNCLHMKGRIWIDLTYMPARHTRCALPPLLGDRRKLPFLLQYGRTS